MQPMLPKHNPDPNPQSKGRYGFEITSVDISKALYVVQDVLVPEYLLGANEPLAIRLTNYAIKIWVWDVGNIEERVSATFMVVGDNHRCNFSEKGLMVRRHLGTVFEEGYALHLLHLVKIPEIPKQEPVVERSKEEIFIDLVKREADGIELTYAGRHSDCHKFKWVMPRGGNATLMSGFAILEHLGLKPIIVDTDWIEEKTTILFYLYHKDW